MRQNGPRLLLLACCYQEVARQAKLAQGGPEETIQAGQCRARPFALEYSDLLPQREDFQRGIHATAEEDPDGSEE